MPKAVLITETNKASLTSAYAMEPDRLDDMVGLYLVADFAASAVTYGYLTEEALDYAFLRSGISLKNEFFEITKRLDQHDHWALT